MSPTHPLTRWDDLKQRLQRTSIAMQAASSRDRERQSEIFRQRAAQLAKPVRRDGVDRDTTRTVVFVLGDQHFGMPLSNIGQVYPARNLTPVPRAPSWNLGIANFDGHIRSVIDLAELLNVSGDRATGRNILLVHCMDGVITVQVDRVEEVQRINLGQLSAPDEQSEMARTQFIRGVTAAHVVILSANALVRHVAQD